MKKLRNILVIGLLLLMVLPLGIGAAAPYKTYTYSPDGELLSSPDAYVPDMNIDYKYIGISYNPNDKTTQKPLHGAGDLFVGPDEKVYIADSANNRILVLSKYYKLEYEIKTFVNDHGVPDTFANPAGVFVTEDYIYVCDTDNNRIVLFHAGIENTDESFIKIIERPESNLFEEGSIYKPVACAVDQYGRIFVISSTTYQGVIVMNDKSEFFGFIGAQSETLSAFEILWRRFQTAEQRAQNKQVTSLELNNISIDADNFIYVTTSAIDEGDLTAQLQSKDAKTSPVKKHNASGADVMKRNAEFAPSGEVRLSTSPDATIKGPSKLVDVGIGPTGTWSIIDEKRSKIYTYDENGNLLYAFGDMGEQVGNVSKITAVAYQGTNLVVLDSANDSIVVYKRTEYGDLLMSALENDANRLYHLASEDWTKILQKNNNYSMAYLQLGKAAARDGDYDTAMNYFVQIGNTEDYSAAYKEIRSEWAKNNFWIIPIVVIAVAILVVKFFGFAAKVNKRATLKIGRRNLKEEVLYAFYIMFHPFDGFWDLKREKRGSAKSATVILFLTVVAFFYKSVGTNYMHSGSTGDDTMNIVTSVLSVILPLFLWVIANWCFTTLFEGEGSMKDIYISSCYALIPLPLIMIPTVLLTNVLTVEESGIISMLYGIAFLWLGILLVFGTQITHDYSMGKNILTCLVTIAGMAFIMFIVILFSTLMTQIVGFISNIVTELSFRM